MTMTHCGWGETREQSNLETEEVFLLTVVVRARRRRESLLSITHQSWAELPIITILAYRRRI